MKSILLNTVIAALCITLGVISIAVAPPYDEPVELKGFLATDHHHPIVSTEAVTPDGKSMMGFPEARILVEKDPNTPMHLRPKIVALTFDDGPHKTHTRDILHTLNKLNVKATFYLVGQEVALRPKLAKDIADAGHQIGNHTYSHPWLKNLSPSALQEEIRKTDEAILAATGIYPTTVRPPFGDAPPSVQAQIDRPLITWSVDTKDWQTKNGYLITRKAIDAVHPGAVILLHDTNQSSAAALPYIIGNLKMKGYQFVTIDALFGFDKDREQDREEIYYYSRLKHLLDN